MEVDFPLKAGGGIIVFSNEVISGGARDDYLNSGLGADRIHSGAGIDILFPNGYHSD